MPAPSIPKEEVIKRLAGEFRRWGYDGATLSRLSAATGLVKASLYHYFPKGKEDMARAVLSMLDEQLKTEVVAPADKEKDPKAQLHRFFLGLSDFYLNGKTSCLMEVFTLGTARELFREELHTRYKASHASLSTRIEACGIGLEQAAQRATQALAAVQGGLIIARITNDATAFQSMMAHLSEQAVA